MTAPDLPYPDVPALTAWHEAHPYGHHTDRPALQLWMPHEPPYAILQTIDLGCQREPILRDPARPLVNLRLGGSIDIGGYLDELERYVDAMRDALRLARWQADVITARMTAEAEAGDDAAVVAGQDVAATEGGQRPRVIAHLPEALDSTADAVEDWARTQGDG